MKSLHISNCLLVLALLCGGAFACRTPRPSVPASAPARDDAGDKPADKPGDQPGPSVDASRSDRPASADTAPFTDEPDAGAVDLGSPVVTRDPCQSGQHSCDGKCVDSSQPMHCGLACDPCPTLIGGTATCDGSKCGVRCPPGQKPCDDRCIDENRPCDGCKDGKNECGGICVSATDRTACGRACAVCPTSPYGKAECDGTACLLTCNPGYHRCGDKCMADDDATACGAGCLVCPGTTNGIATCGNGACSFRCGDNFRPCDGRCLGPDQPCNSTCPSGRQLCGGKCVLSSAVTAEICDGKDNDCNGMTDEGLSEDCSNKCTKASKTCRAGKWDASSCPAAVQCCGDADCGSCKECRAGACVNQAAGQDRKQECGGQGCNAGRCNACVPNQKVCEGKSLKTCAADGSRWNVDTSCTSCENLTCIKCTPKTESCNGVDDDCDGRIDEDLAPLPCNPTCAGSQTCRNGGWDASSCARTDLPQRCGPSCTACPAPAGGGAATCNGGVCGATCPGGKLCGGNCVPNAQLCDGQCDQVRCRFGCVPTGTACPSTKPLKLFYGVQREDNYTVGHPQGESNARNAGYFDAGTVGHAERTQLPGTVPLKCFYNPTDPDNLVTTGGAPAGYGPCGLGDGNVEAYVYTSARPGLIALKRWFSAARNEYHTVTAELQSDQVLRDQGYVVVGVEGYVFSQPQ